MKCMGRRAPARRAVDTEREMAEQADDGAFGEKVRTEIERLRLLVQADGGDIELVAADEDSGVVSVRMKGACAGCPGAAMTLKMGIERNLREKVPQVTEVVAV